jgi:hypothetical protein
MFSPPPPRGGFRVLPATRACLQGFCEFLKCYRSATEVLPICYRATKAGTKLRMVADSPKDLGTTKMGSRLEPFRATGAKDVKRRKCFPPRWGVI